MNDIDIQVAGSRGGISLGWKQNCSVSLQSMSDSHIDVLVSEEGLGLD